MGLLKEDPKYMDVYGIKFKWSPLHKDSQDLSPLLHTYDELSTRALEYVDEIAAASTTQPAPRNDAEEANTRQDKRFHRNFFNIMKQHVETQEPDPEDPIQKLWEEIHAIPDWVDWEQIERGQKVFWRYGGPAVTSLMFLSLLGGMGGGRIVETLDRTGGFGAQAVRRRLLETTQHTLGVHKDLKSIQPGGEGWESSVRVRLLHSSVRRRIMQLAAEQPGYYSLAEYGVPINDLDCIGTINTFSSALVWLGLPRQGIWLRAQETRDYLAVWRYVAYLMGTPHDWLGAPDTAKAMMESLLLSEIKPSKKSGVLANNIITGFVGTPPLFPSRGFLHAQTYWLNGSELAKELRIEEPNAYHMALTASQTWMFMLNSYISRSVSFLDERNIKFMRSMFYELLVENKEKGGLGYRTNFSFKWVPNLLFATTPLGVTDEELAKNSGAFRVAGLERLALLHLLVSFSALAYFGYAGGKVAYNSGLSGWVRQSIRSSILRWSGVTGYE